MYFYLFKKKTKQKKILVKDFSIFSYVFKHINIYSDQYLFV